MLNSLDYAVNIEKKTNRKISENIISFRGVFAPTCHIYKPLIENPRDHLDSDLFLLTRWEMFADHSGRRFCEFDFVQLYESKTCDNYLSRARDVNRGIRSRPGHAYETP